MSSLVSTYKERLDIKLHEKNIAVAIFKVSERAFFLSDDSNELLKQWMSKRLIAFIVYVCYERVYDKVAYEGYENEIFWYAPKVKELFESKHLKAIELMLSRYEDYICDTGLCFDEAFSLDIQTLKYYWTSLVKDEIEYEDNWEYGYSYGPTEIGSDIREKCFVILKENLEEILFKSLEHDNDIVDLMLREDGFSEHLKQRFNAKMDKCNYGYWEYEEVSKIIPKMFQNKEYNLWDAFSEFVK